MPWIYVGPLQSKYICLNMVSRALVRVSVGVSSRPPTQAPSRCQPATAGR
ncbi:hypothetical protein E2562_030384 [Oryza meyeriana var. granulata]|uniref:Uncharacterized protein n=1 Tax=Oryza meyeriana var. granulata TaxID=110450 RepID=A0A6G1DPZ8_9ORYZ|nr:hypothetical protein E2562_030384 [Oryza meyeriana var. granulata]